MSQATMNPEAGCTTVWSQYHLSLEPIIPVLGASIFTSPSPPNAISFSSVPRTTLWKGTMSSSAVQTRTLQYSRGPDSFVGTTVKFQIKGSSETHNHSRVRRYSRASISLCVVCKSPNDAPAAAPTESRLQAIHCSMDIALANQPVA